MPRLIIVPNRNTSLRLGYIQSYKSHHLDMKKAAQRNGEQCAHQVNTESKKVSHHGDVSSLGESLKNLKTRKNFFPYHLMLIINNPRMAYIVSWTCDGKSIMISDTSRFSDVILSKNFYRSSNMHSFTRKMHRWGFKMITRGEHKYEFYHPLFVRDYPFLYTGMTRKTEGLKTSTKKRGIGQGLTARNFEVQY